MSKTIRKKYRQYRRRIRKTKRGGIGTNLLPIKNNTSRFTRFTNGIKNRVTSKITNMIGKFKKPSLFKNLFSKKKPLSKTPPSKTPTSKTPLINIPNSNFA
jgi:hypothetical protein